MLLFLYYISIAYDNSKGFRELIKVYLDNIIAVLNSIFKTILWFIICLVGNGWQITKTNLSRDEMRKFIGLYISIYLIICVDQVVDMMRFPKIGFVNF